jgi:hypothetical protein
VWFNRNIQKYSGKPRPPIVAKNRSLETLKFLRAR